MSQTAKVMVLQPGDWALRYSCCVCRQPLTSGDRVLAIFVNEAIMWTYNHWTCVDRVMDRPVEIGEMEKAQSSLLRMERQLS